MSASDNLSTKCSGLLLRRSFAILAARTRHLISAALMPAFSVASRPSNSSDIAALISIPKHKSINGGLKNAGRCPKKSKSFNRGSQHRFLLGQLHRLSKKRHSRRLSPVLAARDLKNSDGQTSSKNCSLNRDVECPSVGAIFCSAIGQPWRFAYHCRERRPRTPSTSTSAAGCGCAA